MYTHLLGKSCRHGDDAHKNLIGAAECFQLIDMQDRMSVLSGLCLRFCIKCGKNIQTVRFKSAVTQQRLTQLACTDQNRISRVIISQKLFNVVDQAQSLVTDFRPSAVRNSRKILAYLHFTHAQCIGQSRCGNIGGSTVRNGFQIGQIPRKTLQYGFGYFSSVHVILHINRYKSLSIHFYIDYSNTKSEKQGFFQAQLVCRINSLRNLNMIRFSNLDM